MEADQQIWRVWADRLNNWGIQGWIAGFLETAGPLNVLGAQLILLGKPVLNFAFEGEQLDSLARLLEDSSQTRAFVTLLREVPTS